MATPRRTHNCAFPDPIPVPEPPRVVCLRSLVPDVSLTSDMGSCAAMSPLLQHEYRPGNHTGIAPATNTPSPMKRYNISRPISSSSHNNSNNKNKNQSDSGRQPLKPIQRTTPVSSGNRLPVVRHHSDNQSAVGVDRICQIIEKHDEQLQLISQQIETLLRLQKEVSHKPVTCNAETNTSRVWPVGQKDCSSTPSDQRIARQGCDSSGKSDSRRGILRKTVTHDTTCMQHSIECGRFQDGDENDDGENEQRFFHTMLSDISDILSRSSETDDSIHTRSSPVKRRCTNRNRVTQPVGARHPDSVFGNAGSETIYIKHMAAKYLSPTQRPATARDTGQRYRPSNTQSRPHKQRSRKSVPLDPRNEVTSIATKNYLQRYGLTFGQTESPPRHPKPKNKLLDLSRLDRLPKFI